MALRLIPISIVSTIFGVLWLGSILSGQAEAEARAEAPEIPTIPVEALQAPTPTPNGQAGGSPVEGKDIQLEQKGYVNWTFHSVGGGLRAATLLNPQFDRREPGEDTDGVGIPAEKMAVGPLDLVTTWDDEFYPFVESFSVFQWESKSGQKEDVVAGGNAGLGKGRSYGIVQRSENEFLLVWPDPKVVPDSEIYLSKKVTLGSGFTAKVAFSIYNFSSKNLLYRFDLQTFGWQGKPQSSMIGARPNLTSGTCRVGEETFYETFEELLGMDGGGLYTSGDVSWVGVSDQYFLLGVIQNEFPAASCALQSIPVAQNAEGKLGLVQAGLSQNQTRTIHAEPEATCIPEWLPSSHPSRKGGAVPSCEALTSLIPVKDGESMARALKRARVEAQGDTAKFAAITEANERMSRPTFHTFEWTLFAGPKEIHELESVGEDKKLSATLDFGILEAISEPMLLLLGWAHDVLSSWALAIVFLTIVVKVLLFPLTRKSLVQMKRMQELKPEMDKLKEKYDADKQRLNQEMFALYKRHNVNPLGGCLPMFIQMPIYIALYNTLYASVSLYQQPLFGWVTDLTKPDPFYVMPLILGLTMYLQQHMTPTTMDSQQAQIMKYVMPVMFTGFMLFLPSGLVLYIFTNTVLTLLQQFLLNRQPSV